MSRNGRTLARAIAENAITKNGWRAGFDTNGAYTWSWFWVIELNEEFGFADDYEVKERCSSGEREVIEGLLQSGTIAVEPYETARETFYLATCP